MIESGIDVTYPVFAAAHVAIADAPHGPMRDGGGEAVPVGSVAHQVVTAALAAGDHERAERIAQLARQLLPDDATAASDLARAREARRQVEQERTVQDPSAHHDRLVPVADERE